MAGDATFGQLHRMLELYAPDVPPPLLRQFVNNSYSRALVAHDWSELRGAGGYYLDAPYTTGTVTATEGSTTVTGSGTAWTVADHQNLQLVVGTRGPFYDITAVDAGAQTLTLSRPYTGATVSGSTYAIQLIYIVAPSDLLHFTYFADMGTDWWTLDRQMTQETLDFYDPRRAIGGARPVQLVNASPSPFTSTLSLPRYELWPRPTAAMAYFFRYVKKLPLLSDNADTIIYPIRGDVVREGALADLALWPGTKDAPNNYYQPDAAQLHDQRFQQGVALMKVEDQGIRQTTVSYADEYKRLFPFPGRVLSNAAVTYIPGIS